MIFSCIYSPIVRFFYACILLFSLFTEITDRLSIASDIHLPSKVVFCFCLFYFFIFLNADLNLGIWPRLRKGTQLSRVGRDYRIVSSLGADSSGLFAEHIFSNMSVQAYVL